MSRFPAVCLLAVASLAGAAAGGRGDGPLLAPSLPPPPAAVIPLEGPPLVPTVLAPAPCHPMTLCEFASTFKPAPGSYEVWLINPVKCCPVKVCFHLPCGCPQVKVCKREVVFDYGCHLVKISFGPLFGKLRVVYR